MTEHGQGPAAPQRIRRKRVVLAGGNSPVTVLRARGEVEQQTSMGELLVRNLIRAQLRVALGLAAIVTVLFGAIPLLSVFLPAFNDATLLGVPLPWLLLGVLAFPVLFAAGYVYNRMAERNERDFVDMVEN
ncbi:hypothetical protein [Sciscionella sediminilitoris]|uniref:hypothetical protein n=1 Tax=Sciscionella sediminilitoris TaxID=1445613 RepID=UPI000563AE87|nr:hypothetical protein [Sciscionella sp. SE31]